MSEEQSNTQNPEPSSEEQQKDYSSLSDAISSGIAKGFFSIVGILGLCVVIAIAIIFLTNIASSYYDSYTHNKCVERGECIDYNNASIAYTNSPVSVSEFQRQQPILCSIVIGNSSFNTTVLPFTSPSYAEANEKYKTMYYEINKTLTNSDWLNEGLSCSEW